MAAELLACAQILLEESMRRFCKIALLVVMPAALVLANPYQNGHTPEIDPGSAASALTLLAGALLALQARRRS